MKQEVHSSHDLRTLVTGAKMCHKCGAIQGSTSLPIDAECLKEPCLG